MKKNYPIIFFVKHNCMYFKSQFCISEALCEPQFHVFQTAEP